MKRIRRSEIVDYQTYEEIRPEFRSRVMAEKDRRRIHVGDCFTFLFENELTMRYQVQEMMRAERIVKESAILHEMAIYDGVLGGPGELVCTMLIELEGIEDRRLRLLEWRALPEYVYLRSADGRLVRPRVDEGQRDGERISSVQYLKFHVGEDIPVAIGIDLPGIADETPFTEDQRKALAEDLAD
jgi:hypothetical protein